MINKFFKILVLLLITGYWLLVIAQPIFATVDSSASCWSCNTPGGFLTGMSKDCICCGDCQLIDFLRIGRIIIQGFWAVIGVYALIYMIVGGIMMMISGGKQEKVLQGKRMIGFSIVGLIIAFLAWQIINLVICGITQGRLEQSCQIFGQAWNVFPQ
jgi:hypothetical protein